MPKAKVATKTKRKVPTPKVLEGVALDSSHSKETNKMVHVPKSMLAPPKPRAISIPSPFEDFSSDQVEIIKGTVAKGLTDFEFRWFLTVAKKIGLDPLRRQIHAVKRWSNRDQKEVMTIQTGIDGFRAVADRTGCYAPSERPPDVKYAGPNKDILFSITFWVKKFTPRDRSWHEYSATVLWDEFVPLETKDGQKLIPFMWQKMPYNQLEKCAEAKALRRGFPEQFADIYVHEEMQRADIESQRSPNAPFNQGEPGTGDGSVQILSREDLEAEKRHRERGTLEPGKEKNRGHGQEAMEDQGPQPGTRAMSPQEKKAEEKEAARKASLETLDTWVEKVTPLLQKLSAEKENENRKLKAQGKPEKWERKPYFAVQCSGDLTVYAWSTHVFRAVTASQGKDVTWRVSRNKPASGSKTYINLEEIVMQGGVPYAQDPETNDWVPATNLRTEAPSSPDRGESAPVNQTVENVANQHGVPRKEELFGS